LKQLRKTLFVVLFAACSYSAMAQATGYYQTLDRKYKKYFVGITYGVGTASWYSNLGNTELYDKNGSVIRSGDMRFKAKNSTDMLNLEVSAPVAKIRIGLGVSFENFYLDKLTISSNTPGADGAIIVYDESFRFEKFYLHVETPFKFDTDKPYSFGFKGHIGYFGFSGVKHFNFFGDEHEARTFFTNLGLVADYKILSHTYFYINPSCEYKYFRNSPAEAPSEIKHNIVSFSIVGGLRFDVSRE
jgi:hypothetical protein